MVFARAKFIRMSPRKLRRVINVVRGKHASDAMTVLKFMPYRAAGVIQKILHSAIANAKNNENLNPDELKVSKAYVDQSTTLRRWRPMSRGRGYPILKRTSHVTIELSPTDIKPKIGGKISLVSDSKKVPKHEHKEHKETKEIKQAGKKQVEKIKKKKEEVKEEQEKEAQEIKLKKPKQKKQKKEDK